MQNVLVKTRLTVPWGRYHRRGSRGWKPGAPTFCLTKVSPQIRRREGSQRAGDFITQGPHDRIRGGLDHGRQPREGRKGETMLFRFSCTSF